jgi:2-succinyl-6-hydroxy-2,4-cyclohexadiene-1-carboxylate synthase
VKGCPSRRRIEVRGLPYSVLEPGRGPSSLGTVLFLHGFAGGADDWSGTMEMLRASGVGSAAVDLPGHGLTGAPDDAERYAPASVARDLAEILDALGLPSAHVAAYSMGARVALRMALDAPERVRSLILESATTGIAESEARRERRERDESLARNIESRGIEWFVAHWEALPIFSSQRTLPPAACDAQRARRLRQRPEGLAHALRGLGQGAEPDLTPRLSELRVPTLLLAGELDPPYLAHAERIASLLPDAERVVIGGAGHNTHLERPERFGRTLLDRLARLEAPAPERAHA